MSGNTSKDEKEEAKSRMFVEFERPGSAQFSLNMKNVTANQISALAGYLEVYSKTMYSGQVRQSLQQLKEQQLSVPKPEIEVAK